jgi:catechol 2,3-dioxygenase-like lactoylglutathione lyase family enzyme
MLKVLCADRQNDTSGLLGFQVRLFSARPRRVKGIGEVSIRVKDLDAMHKFYEEVVGLEVLRRDQDFVFFKIAEGYGGHTQNLALFEASNTMFLDNKAVQLNSQESTLHHIALNVALEDFESEKMRLEGLGLKVNATVHEWLHVRSLYFPDPEGNLLEFVCYDASVG